MNYIKQILYDLRQQPLVTWITFTGTALSLFLVMSVFMVNRINVAEVAPETNRARILYGAYLHIKGDNGSDNSSGLNYDISRELYDNLNGVETVSFVQAWNNVCDLSVSGQQSFETDVKAVDVNFWNIYDFNFTQGHPFDREAAEAGVHTAVITEDTAVRLFGKGNKAVGNKILIDMIPYTVAGVVNNSNPLMTQSYAKIYIPLHTAGLDKSYDEFFGKVSAVILMNKGVTRDEIAAEVQSRYAILNNRLKERGMEAIYHEAPFDTETMSLSFGSNNTPDIESKRTQRWATYIILLLLPAINLSSMTRSRMRLRMADIGVRRAFGCRRSQIMWQLLYENFLITFVGGIIGLLLSILFVVFASNYFVNYTSSFIANNIEQTFATPTFEMLFSWSSFGVALLFCFVLNLLSAGFPSWKAACINPAVALGSHGK